MLAIQLFGNPQVTVDGRVVKIPRRKSRAMLYYLAAAEGPVTRDHLLALFWPDEPRPAAQQVLRTTLYGLRQAVDAGLQVEDDRVGLAPETQVDVRRFEQILSTPASGEEELSAGLELYRGDFLADFNLPDSPGYEEWITVERERYHRLAVQGLTSLSRLREAAGDYPAALAYVERALAFDPLQEDLQRESIRLMYLGGDRPGAIRRYDQLRKLLDEEMGVPPMVETRNLYDAILNDQLKPAPQPLPGPAARRVRPALPLALRSTGASLPFTGRSEEMQHLESGLRQGKLAIIEGQPGIGKTRLAEELIRHTGCLPVAGAAHELEQALPYQPVIDALRDLLARPDWPGIRSRLELQRVWLAETARLLPEIAESEELRRTVGEAAPSESRLWEGIRQFLQALGRTQPVIFFIDDLQWADASTLALIGYLVRQRPSAVGYLAAARPIPPRSPAASLLLTLTRADRLVRVPLKPLAPEEIIGIAREISPTYAYPLSDWLARNSEGNPYFLAELVRYLRENHILMDGELDLSALSTSPVVPQTIYALTQTRLARLAEPARRVLDAAVAVGREFEPRVVMQAAGLSEDAALDALDELQSAGLVHPVKEQKDGGAWPAANRVLYTFDHNLTMEVAYREVGEARHRLMHRRVAEALENIYRNHLEPVAGLIASHFLEGGEAERAAPYAVQAGNSAVRIAAWSEAAEFYRQALASETDPERRRAILVALGDAQMQGGNAVQASETYRMALTLSKPGSKDAGQARLQLATSLLPQARFAEAIALARQVADEGRPDLARQAQFTWGTALSLEGADLEGATEHLQQAYALCSGQPDLVERANIQFELGSIAAQQGDLPKAIDLYRQSLDAAQQAVDAGERLETSLFRLILAYNNLAYHLLLNGDPSAGEYARKGLALAQEKGILALQTYLFSTLGEIALAEGALDEAEANFEQGLALAEQVSMRERIAGLTANLGLVAKARGQSDLAIHRLSTALTQADSLGLQHLSAQVRIWLAPLLPPAEARLRLSEARAIAESSGRKRLLQEIEDLE